MAQYTTIMGVLILSVFADVDFVESMIDKRSTIEQYFWWKFSIMNE